MKYNKIIKFMVLLLSILTANLITTIIDEYVLTYKHTFNPYLFTWIGMLIVVLIYYPLFTQIDKWSTKYSDKFIKVGKKITGKKTGILITFIVALLILYYFYGRLWFHINVIEIMFHKTTGI